MRQIIGNKFK